MNPVKDAISDERDGVPLQGLPWRGEASREKCGARTGAACGTQVQTGFRILSGGDLFSTEPGERAADVSDAGEVVAFNVLRFAAHEPAAQGRKFFAGFMARLRSPLLPFGKLSVISG
jgi:hypothetical protein